MLLKILLLLTVGLNLFSFILMGLDKFFAIRGMRRIPERTLLIVCGLFGAVGGLMGMHLFRHKTRKPKFSWGVPAMLVLQIALLLLIRFVL